MPTQFKKIILHPDSVETENLRPYLRNSCFGVRTGQNGGASEIRT